MPIIFVRCASDKTYFRITQAGGRHNMPPPRASGDSGRWHINCWRGDSEPKWPVTLNFDLLT